MTKKFRARLEIGDARPWSDRAAVSFKGCSRQLSAWNFLYEVADLHWADFALRNDLPLDGPAPAWLVADVRQNIRRQRKDGSITMLSKSLAYLYSKDRCLCPEEMMLNQGWDDNFSCEDLTLRVEGWPEHLRRQERKKAATVHVADGPAAKRRTLTRIGYYSSALVDLAGNGMDLPDLSLMIKNSLISAESDLFENPPPEDFTDLVVIEGPAPSIEVGASMPVADRRALQVELGDVPADFPAGPHGPGSLSGGASLPDDLEAMGDEDSDSSGSG